MTDKVDLLSFDREGLARYLGVQFGEKPYRAIQIFQWIYKRRVSDFSEMSDLSASFRRLLAENFFVPETNFSTREVSADGTRKYLVPVRDHAVESVMIKQPNRMTLCVSSQVGCGMGCAFCRTATMGFVRHLSVSEILRQVVTVVDDAKHFGDMFSNMVFMGMGEPLHNLANIRTAISVLTDPYGFNLAPRKITVSTVGLVPRIREFSQTVKANIAVSLNATTDEVRSRLMPVNQRYPLDELLACLREYPLHPRKRITIEYVMIDGLNDSVPDLVRLPKLLSGIPAKVNLIPYNENAGLGLDGERFRSPSREHIVHWQSELNRKGVETTIRWSKGRDISAACGQLATTV